MNETTITISGNLVSDVTYRVTARGDAMASFRVASSVSRYDRDEGRWVDAETSYWNVTAWRRAAVNARESLAKGHPVVVHGRVRQRVVDREVPGAQAPMSVRYTDVDATSFGLDLSRCRAQFQRAPIGPQTTPDPAGVSGREGELADAPDSVGSAPGEAGVAAAAGEAAA